MNKVAKTIELAYKAFHQKVRGIVAHRETERGNMYEVSSIQGKDENTLYVLIPWNLKSATNSASKDQFGHFILSQGPASSVFKYKRPSCSRENARINSLIFNLPNLLFLQLSCILYHWPSDFPWWHKSDLSWLSCTRWLRSCTRFKVKVIYSFVKKHLLKSSYYNSKSRLR